MAPRRGPERALQDMVIEMAILQGWRAVHFRPARTLTGWRTPGQGNVIGFPDLVAIRRDRLVVAELKSDRGKTTQDQTDWLAAWSRIGAETYVWRPGDVDVITAVLS